jgi:hypothetical protein
VILHRDTSLDPILSGLSNVKLYEEKEAGSLREGDDYFPEAL